MTVWALIPVKPFTKAKSRLSGIMPQMAREALALALFVDTLTALSKAAHIDHIAIVTAEEAVRVHAERQGAAIIPDTACDLNGALELGRRHLINLGASFIAVFPADLPALKPDDANKVIETARKSDEIVIAPDHDQNGTNALLTAAGETIPYAFGSDSFCRHKDLAENAGHSIRVLNLPRIALDLDHASDIARIAPYIGGSETERVLHQLKLHKNNSLKESS